MRDYINRLSRGKSIIEVPKLTFENEQAAMLTVANVQKGTLLLLLLCRQQEKYILIMRELM